MSLHESAEMYLETIYSLSKVNSTVRSIDVAEALGYSRPSVSRAVGLLKNDGYLTMDKDGFLALTEKGTETAEKIYERHTILTAALMALGVDKETAAEDACKIEHDISDRSFEAIKKHMKTYMPK
ncbi:MAG: metal-dependent transcriptional regulator [Oscillospiraceae bacterium]|nr:metal-dependent transcriptional regulator [Oscillospiraceae bacterium]